MKFRKGGEVSALSWSHPARGAWIEISSHAEYSCFVMGRTPQGVRGLKYHVEIENAKLEGRTPQGVRGLKYLPHEKPKASGQVAPRKGCVD